MRNVQNAAVRVRSLPFAPVLQYVAKITSTDLNGRISTYYDGGNITPYCVETLLQTLGEQVTAGHGSPTMILELRGACDAALLDALAAQFEPVAALGARVEIRSQNERREVAVPHG